MSTNLNRLRAVMIDGIHSCNIVSPADMNSAQLAIYVQAQQHVEQIGEILLEEGECKQQALSLLDKISKGL